MNEIKAYCIEYYSTHKYKYYNLTSEQYFPFKRYVMSEKSIIEIIDILKEELKQKGLENKYDIRIKEIEIKFI